MKVYMLEREGFDYIEQTLVYASKDIAVNKMIEFALTTKCVAVVYVFERQENFAEPFKLIESIQLKFADDPRFYMIWKKQEELGLTTNDALCNLSLFHDTIHVISSFQTSTPVLENSVSK
jgi:hypothetical protein